MLPAIRAVSQAQEYTKYCMNVNLEPIATFAGGGIAVRFITRCMKVARDQRGLAISEVVEDGAREFSGLSPRQSTGPTLGLVHYKHSLDSVRERAPAWVAQAQQHQPVMDPWGIAADVGEVEILRDEKPARLLGGVPYGCIVEAGQSFLGHGVYIVPKIAKEAGQAGGKIFVQLDVHEMSGTL